MNKIWIRNCPNCKIELTYKISSQYYEAERKNRKCRKCGCGWSKGQTKETNKSIARMAENVSKSNKGKTPWNVGLTKETSDIIKKISEKNKEYKHTDEIKILIGNHSKQRWKDGLYDNQYGKNYKEFKKYQHKVHKLSHKIKHLIKGYDATKHGKMGKSGAYQIDHIIDIKFGFDNNIPVEKIADISNLQFIKWEENIKKGYYGKSKN
jgi:hypothetical protein